MDIIYGLWQYLGCNNFTRKFEILVINQDTSHFAEGTLKVLKNKISSDFNETRIKIDLYKSKWT